MTSEKGRVLVILLNYKTPKMTADAMHRSRQAMRGIDGEILIVDNDSGDGSFEYLQNEIGNLDLGDGLTQCSIVQSDHNGGFGFGNNVGIRRGLADGSFDYFYIQNSDAFPSDDAISHLRDFLDHTPSAGFAGSQLHGEDGQPHFTQFRFPSLASEFEGSINMGPITKLLKNYQVPIHDLPENEIVQVDWIAGASIMIRKEVFDDIGLFDENFFLYFEEVDLCRRARQHGWTTHFIPSSRVVHLGSVSTGMGTWTRIPQYWLDSRLYYFEKHFGKFYVTLATLLLFAGGSLARLRYLLGGPRHTGPNGFQVDLLAHFIRNIWRPRPPAVTTKSIVPIVE